MAVSFFFYIIFVPKRLVISYICIILLLCVQITAAFQRRVRYYICVCFYRRYNIITNIPIACKNNKNYAKPGCNNAAADRLHDMSPRKIIVIILLCASRFFSPFFFSLTIFPIYLLFFFSTSVIKAKRWPFRVVVVRIRENYNGLNL